MHVLVTDAAGTVGRLVARQLIAAGHTVSGIAAYSHDCLDPAVDFVCAPLHDPILLQLAAAADAVIHLAPLDTSAPGGAGITGVAHVANAAARAGARLLFVSQAAGRPELYRPAETLVATGWAPSLVIRIAPLLGRQLDWMTCRTVAAVMRTKVSARPIRVLHVEDLLRFLVGAVSNDRSGAVDLATPDTTNLITAWRVLRSVDPRLRLHGVRGWDNLFPDVDISAAREVWSFEYGWLAVDAVVDTGRGLAGRRLDPRGATIGSRQFPMPVEPAPRPLNDSLRSVAPDGLEGEFDDRVDPRFPVFSTASLADALPGPLTPITLDVQCSGLRAAGRAMGRVLALGDVVAQEWDSRAIAVFGHRPYVGVSANIVAAAQLPGWTEHAVARRTLGSEPPATELLPFGPPQPAGPRGSVAKAVVTARSLALLRHLRADTQAYLSAATQEHLDAGDLATLPDSALQVRIRLLRDRIHQGWILTALWVIDSGITAATLEHTRAGSGISGVGVIMESERIAEQTAALAALLRADPTLCALAADGNVGSIRALSPAAAAALDAAVATVGHRGRGEAELASPAFGDDPGLLLKIAAETANKPEIPSAPKSLAQRLAASARGSRELAHDTTIRFTHELRMTLRELGTRSVSADLIDTADDVYYLLCDELVTMPVDARLRIKRRRAERDRLQAQHPPDIIDQTWHPSD
ncbi:Rossmann-fold NAD(P)-binding domain-containing protein [Mycobacterium sp. ML4]